MPTPLSEDILRNVSLTSPPTSPRLPLYHEQQQHQHHTTSTPYRDDDENRQEELQLQRLSVDGRSRRRSSLTGPSRSNARGIGASSDRRPPPPPIQTADDPGQMGAKRGRERTTQTGPSSPGSTSGGADGAQGQNGSARNAGSNGHAVATSATDDMNSHVEFRRKNPSLDSASSASQTANLMTRESFSLDHEPPPTPGTPKMSNHSFFELPETDRRNFLLLVLLYFLQGIPMGLAHGSVPFLLKSHLSYGQIGVFTLATYPYSLKLLWSPFVDAIWSPRVGRRKSWIMPIQMLSGFGMIWLGGRVKGMMEAAGRDEAGLWSFTGWFFFLVLMCATQDIAVDGWALTLLSPQNLSYASTAQTVGLTAGQFLSYTVFLAFNSPDFANRWFRSTPQSTGLLTLSGYLVFWGWMYLLVTIGLAVLKREEMSKERDGIVDVYKVMWRILKLKNIQTFIVLHLIAKIGFQANDAVTNLKLIDKGFSQEDMALTVLIDFPFEISLGYYAGKWSAAIPPMHLWCMAFVARLVAAIVAQFIVMAFPAGGTTTWYLFMVICEHVFSTFTSTIMFVAISAFHARISDPTIGGTYMTLLATVSNLGGTFPRFFILKFVDLVTVATCHPPAKPPSNPTGDLITSPFSCVLEAEKHRCTAGGGTCRIERDGYYITNMICVAIGVITFCSFIRPAALKLQALPLRAWRQS